MSYDSISEHIVLIDAPFQGKLGVLGTYLIQGETSVIVDPGPTVSIPYIEKSLRALGVSDENLLFIAPTHIHLDHSAGSWRLMQAYPKTRLLVHPRGSSHMKDPRKLEAGARSLFGDAVSEYGEIKGVPAQLVNESKDNEEIDLNGVTMKVIWTPGHSSHHQCLYVPEDRTLILGDAGGRYDPMFGIVTPTTPPPFNPEKAMDSLDQLISLRPEKACYGHFGFTNNAVQRLEAHKNQILLWSRIVSESLEDQLTPKEILTRITANDSDTARMRMRNDHVERSPMISLMGFIRYHEWKSTV